MEPLPLQLADTAAQQLFAPVLVTRKQAGAGIAPVQRVLVYACRYAQRTWGLLCCRRAGFCCWALRMVNLVMRPRFDVKIRAVVTSTTHELMLFFFHSLFWRHMRLPFVLKFIPERTNLCCFSVIHYFGVICTYLLC